MTKQEARKHVFGCLLAIMSASMAEEIVHDINTYSEADQQRLYEALEDVQRELHRRAN